MQKTLCIKHGIIWSVPMKVINWKFASYILLGLVAVICCVNWFVRGQSFDTMFIVKSISLSATIISFISAIFCAKLWRSKFFSKWLVLIPDMNGVWKGTIQSAWIDPNTQQKIAPISAELTIKQSLFSISCVMKTNEMRSYSINAGFNIRPENQEFQLLYTYISVTKQNIQERSRIHYGTIVFDLDENYDVSEIAGDYWTGRQTVGTIAMKKI